MHKYMQDLNTIFFHFSRGPTAQSESILGRGELVQLVDLMQEVPPAPTTPFTHEPNVFCQLN